ncbi:MAG TPA: alkaline phosphatase [Terriglobales bacterium]|nr:alkaline phosphatase [Terriglobales bacterium]
MRRIGLTALWIGLALSACHRSVSDDTPLLRALRDPPARAGRAILFIGDGMGDAEITIARNYHVGAAGRLAMDRLPLTGECTTYAVEENDPRRPVYVADSAAGGTALATGVKTSNKRVSTAPITGARLATLSERAQTAGLRSGIVTTADLTDATPACFASHAHHRSCRAPAEMQVCPDDTRARGGPGSIAEQMAVGGVDVLLGGGRSRFEQRLADGPDQNRSAGEIAAARGYHIVHSTAELRRFMAAPPKAVDFLLGLFAPIDLDPVWTGEPARTYPGSGPQRCIEGQRPDVQPSLAEMTIAALAWLDRRASDGSQSPGFFLMVEGASIDKRDHAADPCGQIGETIDFDEAIAVGLAYADSHPDTLVVITADHAHASQAIYPPGERDHSPGQFSTLITREGVPLVVNYGTNINDVRQSHSGTQVRVAARGPRAGELVGLVDHTDVFRVITAALGI